jgi:hypothetical protein
MHRGITSDVHVVDFEVKPPTSAVEPYRGGTARKRHWPSQSRSLRLDPTPGGTY